MVNNMLIYNKIRSQQAVNRRKRLLKRKGKRHTAMPLLFLFAYKCFVNGFVERLLMAYITECQCVISSIQQFNAFSPLNKSAGKMTEVNVTIRRSVGRTSILPTDIGKPMLQEKEEGNPTTADTAAGFWETKSHSSLGRFLHASLRSC